MPTAPTTTTTHNANGSQRVTPLSAALRGHFGVRRNGVLNYLLGDHLGSTSAATNYNGSTVVSSMLYKPFGEVRYSSGTLPTRYTFTGQYSNVADFGLMYYGARWYDVSLGRFSSADTLIPEPGNPQSWDRFAYVNNNPLRYTDPSGHWYKPGQIGITDNQDDGQGWIHYGLKCGVTDPYLNYGTPLDMGGYGLNGTPNQQPINFGQQAEEEYTGFSSSGSGQPTVGDPVGVANWILPIIRDNTTIEENWLNGDYPIYGTLYVEFNNNALQINAVNVHNKSNSALQINQIVINQTNTNNGATQRIHIVNDFQYIPKGRRGIFILEGFNIHPGQTFNVEIFIRAADGRYALVIKEWVFQP